MSLSFSLSSPRQTTNMFGIFLASTRMVRSRAFALISLGRTRPCKYSEKKALSHCMFTLRIQAHSSKTDHTRGCRCLHPDTFINIPFDCVFTLFSAMKTRSCVVRRRQNPLHASRTSHRQKPKRMRVLSNSLGLSNYIQILRSRSRARKGWFDLPEKLTRKKRLPETNYTFS